MPVLITAVEAMLEPRFNLASLQATTHPVAPLLIVHGPIVKELGMNAGAGAFGPSAMANAVMGRAIRLILWNIGGGVEEGRAFGRCGPRLLGSLQRRGAGAFRSLPLEC